MCRLASVKERRLGECAERLLVLLALLVLLVPGIASCSMCSRDVVFQIIFYFTL
jgi:hypothetical protein